MKISSEDVLQADSPDRVMSTIAAVGNGARTDRQIALQIGNLDARQGRYYRRAAEILGFTQREAGNSSVLTELGREFFQGSARIRGDLFVRAVLGNSVVQRLIPFVESCGDSGASRGQLEQFLGRVAELGTPGMAKRRVSSYLGWLRHFGLTTTRGNNVCLSQLPEAAPILRYQSDLEPLAPQRFELRDYEAQRRRVVAASEAISYFVDQAARERAVNSHESLVNLMAARLRTHGAVPKANRYIDLSARWHGIDYLFEMKSTTEANPHSQIRRGISQLYEYRYIQNIPTARLVLVVENPLPRRLNWLQEYLVQDRDVMLVWDGNGDFSCPPDLAERLAFIR